MKLVLASLALLVVSATHLASARAEDGSKTDQDYATVKLYFLNRWLPEPAAQDAGNEPPAGGYPLGMGGMMGGGQLQFTNVKIFLDGRFIGNALIRHVDVMPTLNLRPGERKFRIECDGYKPFEQTLTVLRNGSTQWLVIKLEPEDRPTIDPKTRSRR